MQSFELSKWYADCVSDDGNAVILYQARLRWRSVSLHYSSVLTLAPDTAPEAQYSLRRCDAPLIKEDGGIRWQSKTWNASAEWRSPGAGQRNLLFQSDEGALDWNCIAPRAAATFVLPEGKVLHGWGYVEHLKLTLAPWRLPIKQLRWGRFVNATDALVWIDWEGPYRKRVMYLNGAAVAATHIDETEIVLEGSSGTFHLERGRIIREGQLGSTALAIVPQLERIFPAAILRARECKWLSKAVLRRPGMADSAGLAIHEVVEWP